MKNKFKGYYSAEDHSISKIWKNAFFVFDTNILFNLYRWPKSVNNDFIKVLESIQDRIWIPHQVGLEFNRGRLQVIAGQKKKYSEVIDIFNKYTSDLSKNINNLNLKLRHSEIDPDETLSKINEIANTYIHNLEGQKKASTDVYSHKDSIRDTLDKLFKDKVGDALSDSEIKALYKRGPEEYANGKPPGFEDIDKDDDQNYYHNDQKIIAKYGDAILWEQLLLKVRLFDQPQSVVFVTDDKKSDWWRIVYSDGKKTIGPRPELIEDMHNTGKINNFHMYNSNIFLKYAQQFLNSEVTDQSIRLVKDLQQIPETHPTYASSKVTIDLSDKRFATKYGYIKPEKYYQLVKEEQKQNLIKYLYTEETGSFNEYQVVENIKDFISNQLSKNPIKGISDFIEVLDDLMIDVIRYYELDQEHVNLSILRNAINISIMSHLSKKHH
ncbi:PIN-like domain-containing protein [Hymenobacter endophyticus]|uniref:PIN-like domain-containing protein n=1 Tax=Hymenobacter endophyticus TaxID=3076335 RepID=A0ABU3TL98_9BACT|nr:PIN-like domain-containing protein [Hymenobacter endophyticus]MDU0372102.1 PIN-like domain-containing protein [Hymenobacter endophyticus]